jgi:hypothetical protein
MIGTREAALAPDLIESVIGYRVWANNPNYLRSPWVFRNWNPGVNRAMCIQGRPHQAPDPDCACGLYAYYDVHDTRKFEMSPLVDVIGAVRMWGSIEMHTTGMRAEYGEVIALYLCEASKAPISNLPRKRCLLREDMPWGVNSADKAKHPSLDKYQVPLVDAIEELTTIAEQYGRHVDTSVWFPEG